MLVEFETIDQRSRLLALLDHLPNGEFGHGQIEPALVFVEANLHDPFAITGQHALHVVAIVLCRIENGPEKTEQAGSGDTAFAFLLEGEPLREKRWLAGAGQKYVLVARPPLLGLASAARLRHGAAGIGIQRFAAAGQLFIGERGQADAEGGPARKPAIEKVDGEVAANPAIAEPVELQVTLFNQYRRRTIGPGFPFFRPHGVQRDSRQEQRKTETQPRGNDDGQVSSLRKKMKPRRQLVTQHLGLVVRILKGLLQMLHHFFREQSVEFRRVENKRMAGLKRQHIGLILAEVAGHHAQIDIGLLQIRRRFPGCVLKRLVREVAEGEWARIDGTPCHFLQMAMQPIGEYGSVFTLRVVGAAGADAEEIAGNRFRDIEEDPPHDQKQSACQREPQRHDCEPITEHAAEDQIQQGGSHGAKHGSHKGCPRKMPRAQRQQSSGVTRHAALLCRALHDTEQELEQWARGARGLEQVEQKATRSQFFLHAFQPGKTTALAPIFGGRCCRRRDGAGRRATH